MDELIQNLTPALLSIASTILVAISGWVAVRVKVWLDTKTKRAVAESAVKFVEQIGKSLGSEEKFELAKEKVISMLYDVGIKISDVEVKVLIESMVNEFFEHWNEFEEKEQ